MSSALTSVVVVVLPTGNNRCTLLSNIGILMVQGVDDLGNSSITQFELCGYSNCTHWSLYGPYVSIEGLLTGCVYVLHR